MADKPKLRLTYQNQDIIQKRLGSTSNILTNKNLYIHNDNPCCVVLKVYNQDH